MLEVRNARSGNQVFRFGWPEVDQVRGRRFVSLKEGEAKAAGLIKGLEERSGVRGSLRWFIIDPFHLVTQS